MANILKLLSVTEVLTTGGSTVGDASAVRVYNKTDAAATLTNTTDRNTRRKAASTHTIQNSEENATYTLTIASGDGTDYTFDSGQSDRNGEITDLTDPTINIHTGDTLVLDNNTGGHVVHYEDGEGNVLATESNGTVSYQFNTAGTYYYECGTHAADMRGEIVVGNDPALASTNVFTLDTMVGVEIGDVVTGNAAITDNPTVVGIANNGTAVVLSSSYTPIGGSTITLQQPEIANETTSVVVGPKEVIYIQKESKAKLSGSNTTFDATAIALYR